jgi:hypothetical protein
MAKVIENGRFTSVAVEYVGEQFNIWRFDRFKPEYEVFCNQRGGIAIVFSDEDAEALRVDLAAVAANELTKQAFETKLAVKIDGFLTSIKS